MTDTGLTTIERYELGRFIHAVRRTHSYRRTWPAILIVVTLAAWRIWATWGDPSKHGMHIWFITMVGVVAVCSSANWFIRKAQLLLIYVSIPKENA
jgi:hypothetical protein